jgi:hypothetical protein
MVDNTPEKAGGGGSIPSLAAIFSTAYRLPLPQSVPFCSNFTRKACRSLPATMLEPCWGEAYFLALWLVRARLLQIGGKRPQWRTTSEMSITLTSKGTCI